MPRDFSFPVDVIDSIISGLDYIATPIFVLHVIENEFFFIKLNAAHETLTGLSTKTIFDKRPQEIMHPGVAQTVSQHYARCARTGEPCAYEQAFSLPNGEFCFRVTLSPFHDYDGKVSYIIGTVSDITEDKNREREVAKAFSDLKALNDDMEMFTTMAAHDLRSPLASFCSAMDFVLEDFQDLGDGKKKLLHMCSDMALGMIGKINSILGYARSMRLAEPEHKAVDLGCLFTGLDGLLDPKASSCFSYPSGAVKTEPVVLEMIFRNLMDNALKFGRGRILAEIAPDPDNSGFLRCAVADNGPGFQSGAPKVGEASNRGGRKLLNGFGLSAVRRLVEARGGRLWVDAPRFETGATIRFTLPGQVVEALTQEERKAGAPPPQAPWRRRALADKRVFQANPAFHPRRPLPYLEGPAKVC